MSGVGSPRRWSKNTPVYRDIASRFFAHLSGINDDELAIRFGVTPRVITKWRTGISAIPDAIINQEAANEGLSARWILLGEMPWGYDLYAEMANRLIELQNEKFPGKEGLLKLLITTGLSKSRWHKLITRCDIPTKTEQAHLSNAFAVNPVDLFGNISPEKIPPTLYPTKEEMDMVIGGKNVQRTAIDISTESTLLARELISLQGTATLLIAHLMDGQVLDVAEALLNLREPIRTLQRQFGEISLLRPRPRFIGIPSVDDNKVKEEDSPTPIDRLPSGNAIRRKGDHDAAHKILYLKTPGDAAALEMGSTHRGIFDDNALWDDIEIPETTHMVRLRGDSMEPMIMHGQYAMVGPEYTRGTVPGNRDIVIAEVTVQERDIGGVDSEWEGVHCKRIQDGGAVWIFTSINPSGETFSVAKANCRLWPVIGVWFAGKGKPPPED